MLRRPSEFEAVLKSGVRVSTRNFVASALANTDQGPRLGTIAGKKVAPRAVDRNRAKRLIRETFRATRANIGPYDVTVRLRGDLRAQENTALRAELAQLIDILMRRCSHSAAGSPHPHAP